MPLGFMDGYRIGKSFAWQGVGGVDEQIYWFYFNKESDLKEAVKVFK